MHPHGYGLHSCAHHKVELVSDPNDTRSDILGKVTEVANRAFGLMGGALGAIVLSLCDPHTLCFIRAADGVVWWKEVGGIGAFGYTELR